MKKAMCLLLLTSAIDPGMRMSGPSTPQTVPRDCRILDLTFSKGSEVDYVDGIRAPDELGILGFLREREKISPRSCLLAFVPLTTSLNPIEDIRVIAGKVGYEDFHVYIYEDKYRASVNELVFGSSFNSDQLRSGAHGPLPWPDRLPAKK